MDLALIAGLICGAATAALARRNGRNAWVWFAIGALLPGWGLLLCSGAGVPLELSRMSRSSILRTHREES